LEALKDEVRKPLTDWENAEKNRVSGHEEALAAILQAAQLGPDMDSAAIRRHLESVGPLAQRDWQEFSTRATATLDEVRKVLEAALAQATKREAEAAELARLRAEQVAREQKEREERIASEAAERARIAAEAKAKRDADGAAAKALVEQNRIEQEKAQAIARAERVEREAKEAAEEAAEKAERARRAAIEAEQRRHEEAARKVAADATAREADTNHRAKINSAAVAAFVEGGIPEDVAKLAVTLIAKRQVPAVSISY
jgi:flagellar biosynthesis GTPase FlhF